MIIYFLLVVITLSRKTFIDNMTKNSFAPTPIFQTELIYPNHQHDFLLVKFLAGDESSQKCRLVSTLRKITLIYSEKSEN